MLSQETIDAFAKEWNDLKARMEAALKAEPEACEDFGEPWNSGGGEYIKDRYNDYAISSRGNASRNRIIACVNAMQGIANPAAFVERAKRLQEVARATPFWLLGNDGWTWNCDNARCGKWLRELAEAAK